MVGYILFLLGGSRWGTNSAPECSMDGSVAKSCAACLVGSLCAVLYRTAGGPLVSVLAGIRSWVRRCSWISDLDGNADSMDVDVLGFTSCGADLSLMFVFPVMIFLV